MLGQLPVSCEEQLLAATAAAGSFAAGARTRTTEVATRSYRYSTLHGGQIGCTAKTRHAQTGLASVDLSESKEGERAQGTGTAWTDGTEDWGEQQQQRAARWMTELELELSVQAGQSAESSVLGLRRRVQCWIVNKTGPGLGKM